MSDSQSPSCSFSSADSASPASGLENVGRSLRSAGGGGVSFSPGVMLQGSRHWQDVFWLIIFVLHLMGAGLILVVLGLNRFRIKDRLKIDRYTMRAVDARDGLTEDYWPLYAVAGGVGAFLGWIWLLLLGSRANQIMKFAVHILTTYLAVVSVLCFWDEQFFWGVVFAVGAGLQFLYVISAIDRLPFTMLVLQGAVKLVWSLPEVIKISCAFMLVMLLWLGLWSFGASGVVAAGLSDGGSWWLLLVFSVSLFWTAAVLCNTLHVVVSGMVFLVLIHGGREAPSMPSRPLLKSIHYATTTSFGSICYGSLFTAAIRTLRWEIRGLRSKIGNNECLICCVDFLFHLVETLVRFFNKYAYVQIAVSGKSFNHSARDAWELFQSTGVEALIAYDCSGAVLLMVTLLGGLITGTCAGLWTNYKYPDRVNMVGSTTMLMGMVLLGMAMVVVESAVTSIYICFAEDPLLIQRWDAGFKHQMSETLHLRLQHRSARAREVMIHNRLDGRLQEAITI